MIVKNEEDTIHRCLASVADIVDEIIIVDTGSTDNTKAIVGSFSAQVADFVWINDFAAARNTAFSHATMEYILWLDADDFLMEASREKLLALKQSLTDSVDSVTMDYHLASDEFGNITSSVRRNRLVKRANKFQWIGAVHEYLEVWGKIEHSDIAITHGSIHHDNDRNITIYEQRLAAGESFSPRDLYYYANECVDHKKYERAIELYEQFLATRKGWIEDNIASCGKLADCYNALKNPEKELDSTLRSFQYTSPRAEFCCRLGYHFLHSNELQAAIFWYKLASELKPLPNYWGFTNLACSTWLPHLQLCVCYDRTGEYELANQHNEIALKYRPTNPGILHNQKYLKTVLSKSVETGSVESNAGD